MSTETVVPNVQLDREVKEMIAALNTRLANLQRAHHPGSAHHENEDDRGVRIITLSGTNSGATMRSEPDHEKLHPQHHGVGSSEDEGWGAYVNSNIQAINNSIMMEANYSGNDPGVHMDVLDAVGRHPHGSFPRHGRRRSRKGKEPSMSERGSDEHSHVSEPGSE